MDPWWKRFQQEMGQHKGLQQSAGVMGETPFHWTSQEMSKNFKWCCLLRSKLLHKNWQLAVFCLIPTSCFGHGVVSVSSFSQQKAGLAVPEHREPPACTVTLLRVGHSHQSHLPEAGQL